MAVHFHWNPLLHQHLQQQHRLQPTTTAIYNSISFCDNKGTNIKTERHWKHHPCLPCIVTWKALCTFAGLFWGSHECERRHFKNFAVPKTIILEILLLMAGILSWALRAQSGAQHFHARATQACSGALHFSLFCGAPGFAAGQSASQTRPTVRSTDPHFHNQLPRARSGAPPPPQFFIFSRHIPTNIWGEYPPPPPKMDVSYKPLNKLFDSLLTFMNFL